MNAKFRAVARAVMLAGFCLFYGACAGGFDAKWNAAAGRPAADPYSGRWTGEWKSTRGSHRGGLECVFTKTGPSAYRADFHAHWHGLASSYTVPFATERMGNRLQFKGQHDLGPLFGGIYRYRGEVSAKRFAATYESSYDTGVFDLGRVAEPVMATNCFPGAKKNGKSDGAIDSRAKSD